MSKFKWENFSKDELQDIVSNSKTYRDILKAIGYKPCSANNKYVRDFCQKYNIDYSHLNQGKKEDLTGQQFGYMKVLYEDITKNDTKSQNTYWFCECQGCEKHTIKSVCAANLKRGSVISCGCKNRERIIEYNHNKFKDLSGQTFNFLTVIKPIFEGDNFTNKYLCRCVCGKEVEIIRNNLVSGSTKSCGCISMSVGEHIIETILQNMNVSFKEQYTFDDLTGKGYPLRFDFAIFDNDNNLIYLIEYQGKQHYEPISIFGGEEQFKIQQLYDNKKREYCKSNNIKLIEIPYVDNKNINEEYLLKLMPKLKDNGNQIAKT